MFLSEFELAPNIVITSLFYLNSTTQPSKKLAEKYLGPFKVITQVGTHSFTLRLPNSMRAVHPVFHISMLKPAQGNIILQCTQSPPPLVKIDGELEYEISKILDSKINKH